LGVGVCGNIKAEQILVKVLKKQFKKKKKINREWIEQELTQIVKEEMVKSGLIANDEPMPDDSTFLIAFDGKVYIFEDDFSIWRSSRGYQAIGAGSSFAKGALEALHKEKSLSPESKLLRALEAADNLCTFVLPPFTIIEV
jgi:ATP-dependent protease HslVU (ClpYQ) peptidase subunit